MRERRPTVEVWMESVYAQCEWKDGKVVHKTKTKGDLFEQLCVAFLWHTSNPFHGHSALASVWLLADVPEAVLASLKVPRKDNGIDIIARDTSGALHAVQCKFLNRPHNARKRGGACCGSKKIHVNWKPLATFRQLVSAAAGPGFQTSAVMTTGDGVTFWGNKPSFEQHICYDAFTALSRSFWCSAARIGPGKTFSPVAFKPRDTSELRAARLRKYQKIAHGSIPSLPAAAQSASSSSLSTGRAGAAAAAASGGDGGGGETSRCDGAAAPNRATSFASSQSESASPQHGPLLPTSSAPHRWSDPTRGCASKTREEWWITLAKWSNSLRGSMKLRKSIVLGAHEGIYLFISFDSMTESFTIFNDNIKL